MKVLDLFSGIGGFSLGLERAGMETIAFCEIEKYPRKVLAKHWPNIPIYEDVRNVTKKRLDADGIRPNVICGGFPCQDLSVAGNQKGIHAERSGLWSECARLLGEVRPEYAIFENVPALLSGDRGRWFQRVLFDISQVGYNAEWHCISASNIGFPHQRILQSNAANPNKTQLKGRSLSERIQAQHALISNSCRGKDKPGVVRMANGVPSQAHRLGCLGNAVVPQIPELIGRA
ncbi:DNA (cytosine-5-)-methyltransferase, partial [bacterium]|nr:DNA (cytosine-5-)-methyltransferase [bacterium]